MITVVPYLSIKASVQNGIVDPVVVAPNLLDNHVICAAANGACLSITQNFLRSSCQWRSRKSFGGYSDDCDNNAAVDHSSYYWHTGRG